MIQGDDLLHEMNVSELVTLVEDQGRGLLRLSIPRQRLVNIVSGVQEPGRRDACHTGALRVQLHEFIQDNLRILRSQLPACRGACTTFRCPPGIAVNCYNDNLEHFA